MKKAEVKNIIENRTGSIAVWYDYFAKETRRLLGERKIRAILAQYPDDFVVATREDESWGFAEKVRGKGMHLFMHTCGNVFDIIPDLIEIGVNVLHPLQPGTMDAEKITKSFGGKITFFPGVDVQGVVSNGTPERIQAHIDELVRVFGSSGGFLLSCANTIMPETPEENIRALFKAFSRCGQ